MNSRNFVSAILIGCSPYNKKGRNPGLPLRSNRKRTWSGRFLLGILLILSDSVTQAQPDLITREEAIEVIRKATRFYVEELGCKGGYVWRYSKNGILREGEAAVDRTTTWVQPPGTPTIGHAFLAAFQLTRLEELLQAARDSAHHLARGQLRSGGWSYRIETSEAKRILYAYRLDAENDRGRNTTTLDDDTTQSALRFLMRLDNELSFQDPLVHNSALHALKSLTRAQYPNGAWPQRYDTPPGREQFPVKPARYPAKWSREFHGGDYKSHYTLNDNTLADMIETMLLAAQIYQDRTYSDSAKRGGDFLILAQMPHPQPAWAQQYNADMEPAWARKFEPPAVTGGESQGAIEVLINLYLHTGEKRFVGPIRPALDYLDRSRRADGRLARFYELKSNKPLFFTRKYELTYRDDDLPTHYGFLVSSRTRQLREHLRRAESVAVPVPAPSLTLPSITPPSPEKVRALIEALDERGAWVSNDRLRYQKAVADSDGIIDSRVFARNLLELASYVHGLPSK